MSDPSYTLILCSTPHLDWDWLLPFPTLRDNRPENRVGYFNDDMGPAFDIFDKAVRYLTDYPTYTYSICEIGFLRAYIEARPAQVGALLKAGKRLEILGGGITSPDNLLPHGETFIRNYLIGNAWTRAILNISPRQAWLPDDFGHDAQLPVVLAAMGFDGVSFWRIPGSDRGDQHPQNGSKTLADELMKDRQADFIWSASDGSTAVAHWMTYGYQQGGNLGKDPGTGTDRTSEIYDYIEKNSKISPTETLFVPVGDDFMLPVEQLVQYVQNYNASSQKFPSSVARLGTFDDFIQALKSSGKLQGRKFPGNPYWMGYYQTRPRLKRLHHAATRALLGAEAFAVLAGSQQSRTSDNDLRQWEMEVQGRAAALRKAWDDLVPSTHHDYITGTAEIYVYQGEQLPRLEQVAAGAEAMRDGVLREIAGGIKAQPNAADREVAVAVFNQLGFARDGLVALRPTADMAGVTFNSVRIGAERRPVQRSAEGDWLFTAEVGSLGYATAYLSTALVPPPSPPATIQDDGRRFTLKNGFLEAQVESVSGSLNYIDDHAPGREQNFLGGANEIVFYVDSGHNYQYGSELTNTAMERARLEAGTGTRVEVLEPGPLRVRLKCTTTYVVGRSGASDVSVTYVREYALVAGEPMLRLRTTGACPHGYSAMVSFNTREGMTKLAHGTTYHWDDAAAVPYVLGPSMQPTHDFVIPEDEVGKPLFAVYHGSMPAWGQALAKSGGVIPPSKLLLGGLSRNPSGNYFSWFGDLTPPPNGIDPDSHTFDYAIRRPSGISLDSKGAADPGTGLQLRESLGFTTPLLAVPIPATTSAALPSAFSLASVSAQGASQPIITAAKPAEPDPMDPALHVSTPSNAGTAAKPSPNDLVLRIYQASNAAMDVTLCLADLGGQNGHAAMTVTPVTALEGPIPGAGPLGPDYRFKASLALTTLRVSPAQ